MKWTVGKKLLISFILMTVLMAAIGLFSIYNLKQLADNTEELLQKHQKMMSQVASVLNDILFHSLKVEQYVTTGNKAHLRVVEQLRQHVGQNLTIISQEALAREDAVVIQELLDAFQTYLRLSDGMRKNYDDHPLNMGLIYSKQMRIAALLENSLLAKASALYRAKQDKAWQMMTANRKLYERTVRFTLVASILFTLLCLIFGFVIRHSISKPIGQLVHAAQLIAKGDLTVSAPAYFKDDIGSLAVAFNAMTAKLKVLVDDLEMRVRLRTRQLEEERNFISAILDTAEALVVVMRSDGSIVRFNAACEKLTGYTSDEVMDRHVWDLFLIQEEIEPVKAVFQQLRDGQFPNKYENNWITKSGESKIIAWSNSCLVDDTGAVEFVIGSGIDITDRKKAEKELKQAKYGAEAANRSKSAFLATMSHEIRTPMNGVIGMAGLLKDTPLNPQQREFVDTIQSSAGALLTIVNDVLDFSKIEAGKLDLESIPFELTPSVACVVDMLSLKAKEKGLKIGCCVDASVPQALLGDAGRLRQILTNLMANAVKFTDQGEVSVQVRLEAQTDTHVTLRFTVSDTGIGIPADRRDRLFKSFSQLDASTTRKYGGTGLGLAISKLLIEMMGGRIDVESREGQGSRFWFTTVMKKQVVTEQSASRKPQHPRGSLNPLPAALPAMSLKKLGVRVLLVEDNETNKKVAKHILERYGCITDVAEDGALAVAAYRQTPYDIIFMDVQMPVMDGLSATRQIREIENSDGCLHPGMPDHTPIVALTADAMTNDRDKCLAAGMDDYLAKPIMPEALWNKLEQWVPAIMKEK